MKNYINLFNPRNSYSIDIWDAALNTALVAFASASISTILGTLGAIGIYYTRTKWVKNSLDFVTQIPVVNAEIVTAVSLCILFVITSAFLPRSFITLVIGHVVLSIPYVVMSVKPKLEQMDPYYMKPQWFSATHTKALFKVIIPEVFPGILSGFLLAITLSLDDYVITVFTKPTTGGFNTISTYVDEVTKRAGLPAPLRAFTAILFAVILIAVVLMNARNSRAARKAILKGD